jgi:NitT/TauT family transport system permease protein
MTTSTARAPRPRAWLPPAVAGPLRAYLPPALVFVGGLILWQLYYTSEDFFRPIPTPSEIWDATVREWEVLSTAARATLVEALGGLAIGATAGLVVGFLTARWAIARDILLPLAIGASTIPIIAIAPILNNWFGVLNPLSKMLMAALLVFFPVVIAVTRGLVEVKAGHVELMRSYAADDGLILRKVRVPNMLPFFFTALKVGTTLAFIGAIVGEFFGGTPTVLGQVVVNRISAGQFDVAWAAIILGALAAIIAYAVVTLVERWMIPWYFHLHDPPG